MPVHVHVLQHHTCLAPQEFTHLMSPDQNAGSWSCGPSSHLIHLVVKNGDQDHNFPPQQLHCLDYFVG
jgi:hypothetical protein